MISSIVGSMRQRHRSYVAQLPCMFCLEASSHVGFVNEYEVNCRNCRTRYIVDSTFYRLALRGRRDVGRLQKFSTLAQAANRRGFRLTIPAGRLEPLEAGSVGSAHGSSFADSDRLTVV